MVNNAGVGYQTSIAGGDIEEWRDMLETNIIGKTNQVEEPWDWT